MSHNHNTNSNSSDSGAFVDLTDAQSVTTSSRVGNRKPHTPYSKVRGIVALYKQYFPDKDEYGRKRRMSRKEMESRFKGYKVAVFRDYGRRVKGTLNSEKTYIKRHTEPLSFLKYKLKRAKNLDVMDLTLADRLYYHEIGGKDGVDDIEGYFNDQPNVDSISSALGPPAQRRRLNSTCSSVISEPLVVTLEDVEASVLAIPPKLETPQFTDTLKEILNKTTAYEREQIEKKKVEVQTLFGEKCAIMVKHVQKCLEEHPELIGFIPLTSGEEQGTNALDYWIKQHASEIKSQIRDISLFLIQVGALRSSDDDWRAFVHGWKLRRLMYDDEFSAVWKWMVTELNLELKSDKEEMDADDEPEEDLTQVTEFAESI